MLVMYLSILNPQAFRKKRNKTKDGWKSQQNEHQRTLLQENGAMLGTLRGQRTDTGDVLKQLSLISFYLMTRIRSSVNVDHGDFILIAAIERDCQTTWFAFDWVVLINKRLLNAALWGN